MRWTPLLGLLLVTVTLAGCSDGPGPVNPTSLPPPPKGMGTLNIIVVDPSITPLAGVAVRATTPGADPVEGVTDTTGTFVLPGVPPGDYIIRVTKLGFLPTQSSTTVVADEADPRPVRIQMDVDPEGAPYAQFLYWEGYLECGVAGSAVCAIPNLVRPNTTEDQFSQTFVLDGKPDFVTGELIWDTTQQVSPNMAFEMRWRAANGNWGAMNGTHGPSPLYNSVDGSMIEANDLGVETDLFVSVFPGSVDGDPTGALFVSGNGLANLVVSQKFTFVGYAFYGFTPPADWRWVDEQEPPQPSA